MIDEILRVKKLRRLKWRDLSKDLPISADALRISFSRKSVSPIYIDVILANLNINKEQKEHLLNTKKNDSNSTKTHPIEIPLYEKKQIISTQFSKKEFNESSKISIPDIPHCDGAIFALDDGMFPIIKKTDIILYKRIHKIPESIFYGNKYLIFIKVEDEIISLLRYIHKGKDKFHLLLVPENNGYQSKEVFINTILEVCLVRASINVY